MKTKRMRYTLTSRMHCLKEVDMIAVVLLEGRTMRG